MNAHLSGSSHRPASPRALTGCQRWFTVVLLLLGLALVGAAWWSGQVIQARCRLDSRGTSGGAKGATSQLDFTVRNTREQSWAASAWQSHASWAEADTYVNSYTIGQIYPCWYNRLVSGQVTLRPDDVPAGYVFWGCLAAAFLTAGFGLANLASIVRMPLLSKPQQLAIRLPEEGGGSGPALWFSLPMLAALVAFIYALVRVFQQLWPLPGPDADFWRPVTLVFIGLGLAGVAALGYWAGRHMYLLGSGSSTTVEVSALPLSPGQEAQVHVAYRPGRLATTGIQVKLTCQETSRRKATRPGGGTGKTYTYHTRTLHETIIARQTHPELNPAGWQGCFDLAIPLKARPSRTGEYPEVYWAIVVRVEAAGAPDFERTFPIQVN